MRPMGLMGRTGESVRQTDNPGEQDGTDGPETLSQAGAAMPPSRRAGTGVTSPL